MSPTPIDEFPRQYATSRRFTTGVPRNIEVVCDGHLVTFLRAATASDTELTLWAFDTTTGAEHSVVDLDTLGVSDLELPLAERQRRERARESAGGIVAYALTTDRTCACFALGGELYVTDLATRATHHVPTPGSVFDPKFSPDAQMVAFVSDNSLYLAKADGSEPARLVCSEDDPLVSWGRAEFVAAEEMQRSAGYWWSPGSEALIVSRTDDTKVNAWWISDPAKPDSAPTHIRYPAAGTANSSVSLRYVQHSNPSESHTIDWSDNGAFDYLVDVVWDAGHAPLIVRQTRDQRLIDIGAYDVAHGSVSTIHTIQDDTWVEIFPGTPARAGRRLVTIEDRGATRTLCVDGDPVPTVGLQVQSLLGVDDNSALITAWNTPSHVQLLSVDLMTGEASELSEPGGVATGSERNGIRIVTQSTMKTAGPTTTVYQGSDAIGQITSHAVTPCVTPRPLFRHLGKRQLNTAILLPSWHDGSQTLPVLCDPYGGPHAQRVLESRTSHAVSQWFAELGYAVIVADGRGTPGRGPAFEREVYGNLADPVLEDQVAALDAAKAEFSFLDLDRVGIRGWSFGGYLAALAVLKRPDRFHAGLAGAPVTSWALYDTHYTERYLGHPETSPDAYAASDLLRLPDVWDQAVAFPPLMLIHGLADDNVVAAHTLQLSSALLGAGLAHEVLPLTGVTHMTPQVLVAENLLRLQAEFLARALHPTPPTSTQSKGT